MDIVKGSVLDYEGEYKTCLVIPMDIRYPWKYSNSLAADKGVFKKVVKLYPKFKDGKWFKELILPFYIKDGFILFPGKKDGLPFENDIAEENIKNLIYTMTEVDRLMKSKLHYYIPLGDENEDEFLNQALIKHFTKTNLEVTFTMEFRKEENNESNK